MNEILLLVAVGGPLDGRRWVVTEAGVRVGREPTNDIQVQDPNISRQHARVVLYKGAVWVQDAGSRNGVFVNGERVADQREVSVGDKVSIGNHQFEIGSEAGVAPAPPEPAARPKPTGWRRFLPIFGALLAVGSLTW